MTGGEGESVDSKEMRRAKNGTEIARVKLRKVEVSRCPEERRKE